jgi:molybdopterin molybdotransferase
MITLEQALDKLKNIKISPSETEVSITESFGIVLAEDIYSDVDMPPFNKSAMDGFACRQSDLNQPLKVVDYIPAGQLPAKPINEGECAKIMTGAKIPEGADCVIMVEHTRELDSGTIEYVKQKSKSNICLQGEDVKSGDKVLPKGILINPAAIAVAASVGKSVLKVFKPPKIALIATGDELVEVDSKPTGAAIRNSNSYNLIAQIQKTGAMVNYLGIVSDSKDKLEEAIHSALSENDGLILTGGVSMGDKDYVPEILAAIGLEVMYEKLAIQPGKPTAFAYGKGKFCFGLSGNPVSSLLQFELTAKPFIYQFMQHTYKIPFVKMKLYGERKRKRTERFQFFPVKLVEGEAKPLEFHGSAHVAGLVEADGFATFEIGKNKIEAGEEVRVLLL